MSTALRLVKTGQGSGDSEVPPLASYLIWLRGRGQAQRTVDETERTLRRLQSGAGCPIESVPGLAISRFLGADNLGIRARVHLLRPPCLVQLKIARDAPRLLRVRNLGMDAPSAGRPDSTLQFRWRGPSVARSFRNSRSVF